jgi:hypothetical protein
MTVKCWCDRCGRDIPNWEPYRDAPKLTEGLFTVKIEVVCGGMVVPKVELCAACRIEIARNGVVVVKEEGA